MCHFVWHSIALQKCLILNKGMSHTCILRTFRVWSYCLSLSHTLNSIPLKSAVWDNGINLKIFISRTIIYEGSWFEYNVIANRICHPKKKKYCYYRSLPLLFVGQSLRQLSCVWRGRCSGPVCHRQAVVHTPHHIRGSKGAAELHQVTVWGQ